MTARVAVAIEEAQQIRDTVAFSTESFAKNFTKSTRQIKRCVLFCPHRYSYKVKKTYRAEAQIGLSQLFLYKKRKGISFN